MANIRNETPEDITSIHKVHTACFPTDAEACLVNLLRAAAHLTVSLVAEENGEVIGHVAFSPVSAASTTGGIGLGPVGVLAAHRRQGIAAALIRAGLDACRGLGYTWCVVLGNPAYYGRFGYQTAAQYGLSDEYGGGEAFQVMELAPGGIPINAGLVRYSPEFAMVS